MGPRQRLLGFGEHAALAQHAADFRERGGLAARVGEAAEGVEGGAQARFGRIVFPGQPLHDAEFDKDARLAAPVAERAIAVKRAAQAAVRLRQRPGLPRDDPTMGQRARGAAGVATGVGRRRDG